MEVEMIVVAEVEVLEEAGVEEIMEGNYLFNV